MTTLVALAALIALVALLVRYTRHDRFSAGPFSSGPVPQDRFRDNDVWLFHGVRRIL